MADDHKTVLCWRLKIVAKTITMMNALISKTDI